MRVRVGWTRAPTSRVAVKEPRRVVKGPQGNERRQTAGNPFWTPSLLRKLGNLLLVTVAPPPSPALRGALAVGLPACGAR